VKLMIRETYQDPAYAGKPSFPMRRKREAEFRPYAKGSLLSRDLEVDTFRDEDEAEDGGDTEEESEDLEGLAVVEDESEEEALDFADDDTGDDDDGDDDDDE
jgi:hypothetical protein